MLLCYYQLSLTKLFIVSLNLNGRQTHMWIQRRGTVNITWPEIHLVRKTHDEINGPKQEEQDPT